MEFLPGPKVVIEPSVPQVGGPFEIALQWSGFDLNQSSDKGKRVLLIVTTTICVLLCTFFLAVVALTLFKDAKPLTIMWADLNVHLVLSIYALASGVCLASWTKKGFLETFQRELARLRTLRVLPNDTIDNFKPPMIKALIFSVLLISAWTLAAVRNIFYQPVMPAFNATYPVRFVISWRNLYGTMPVIFIWMGVASAIATSIYWLAHEHLRRELTYFNEELVKASRSQQLTLPDVFAAYGRRHLDLMALLQHVNTHLGKLAMWAGLCALASTALSIYVVMSYNRVLTVPYLVLLCLWCPLGVAMLMIIMGEPGKVQETIHQTKAILLDDVTLPLATDQRILSSYRMFMDRCNGCSKMYLLNAIPIGRLTFHMAIFLAPNVSILLTFIVRLIGFAPS